MGQIHIAVTRRVKPGKEHDFETAIREFASKSLHEPGTTGIHLIAPAPGSQHSDYGIMRSFTSPEAGERFYQSDLFKDWQEQVKPLVIGEPIMRPLHGLEAFFRDAEHASPPPRWKMAIVTWLGVFPTVLFWSSFLPDLPPSTPALIEVAMLSICVVTTLTWVVMPLLTRLFRRYLRSN